MLKRVSFSIIFLSASLIFSMISFGLSAQSRGDDPSVGGSSKKTGKTRTYKKARVLAPSTAKKIVKVVEALERQKTVKVPDPDPLNKGKFIEKEIELNHRILIKLLSLNF